MSDKGALGAGEVFVTGSLKYGEMSFTDKVAEFHRRCGLRESAEMSGDADADETLEESAEMLRCATRWLALALARCGDARAERAMVMTEELGELLEALARGDRLAALDALADLLYTVHGTASIFGLPLAEAFEEVHRSNMTKGQAVNGKPVKGPEYRPPDLGRLL